MQLTEATKLRAGIVDCKNLESQVAQKFPSWHWQDMGDIAADKVPGWLAGTVRNLPAGKSGDPIATNKGTLVVFVCARHTPVSKLAEAKPVTPKAQEAGSMAAERETIMNSIGSERLELQARRLLRDLRRAAYLDIRLNVGAPPSGG